MKCPDDELIFRYAHSESDESERDQIGKHIQECESCQKEYRSYMAMKHILNKYWDGKIEGCFDTGTLATYSEGLVNGDLKKRIEEHITYCDICASELEFMKQIDLEEEEIDIPKEADERILESILAKRNEVLAVQDKSLFPSVKADFKATAKRLTEGFVAKYHESERSLVDSLWRMFSTTYHRDTRFGDISFDSAVSAAAGDSKDIQTPTIIFAMIGICDYLNDYKEVPDEKSVKKIIEENTKRFDVSRKEGKKLEEFLMQEFGF